MSVAKLSFKDERNIQISQMKQYSKDTVNNKPKKSCNIFFLHLHELIALYIPETPMGQTLQTVQKVNQDRRDIIKVVCRTTLPCLPFPTLYEQRVHRAGQYHQILDYLHSMMMSLSSTTRMFKSYRVMLAHMPEVAATMNTLSACLRQT